MRKVIIVGTSNHSLSIMRHPCPCGVTRRSVLGCSMHYFLVHAPTVYSCRPVCCLSRLEGRGLIWLYIRQNAVYSPRAGCVPVSSVSQD
jgi:hypothetical protein